MWIESHLGLRLHPKRRQLSRALNIGTAQTVGHLHCLWWWAFECAQDNGDISRWKHADIADGAEWTKDADKFVAALVDSGFLDPAPLSIHDWPVFIGKLLDRRKANRERMQQSRERAAHVHRTKRARAKHVSNSVALPDLTRPDLTGQDQTEPNPSHTPPPPKGGECTLVEQVVNDLNERAGKAFRPSGETATLIKARIKEGATLENFLHVHKVKCEQWRGTEWDKVLRPSTLYRKCNFDGYVNEKTKDQLEVDKKAQELADFERRITKPSIFRPGGLS